MNAPQNLRALGFTSWVVCAAGGIASLLGAWLDPGQFFCAYLLGYLFWLGLTLGSLALLMLYHLVGGAWAIVIRRTLESATRTLPIVGLMFVPILFGLNRIYPWTHPGSFDGDPLLAHKAFYLSTPFFIVRLCLYFCTWIILALLLRRWSGEHEFQSADAAGPKRLRLLCGWGLVLYCLAVTFAAIDWMMSLDPKWFSTGFGMLLIVGQVITALAALILILAFFRPDSRAGEPPRRDGPPAARAPTNSLRRAPLEDEEKPLHDLGNLLFAFTMLWAYLAFVQFLIIWMGNIQEEIPWYAHRSRGIWPWVAVALLTFHFAVPCVVLLLRAAKRRLVPLATVAALVLLMRFVDYLWQMGPDFPRAGWKTQWLFLLTPLALGGAWVAVFARQLQKVLKEG